MDIAASDSGKSPLSIDDIRAAVSHPDAEQRSAATQRLCHSVRRGDLSAADRVKAAAVLQHIAGDVAAIVRRALAITLRNSPELPHNVAKILIRDINSIAVPILEFSPVLTDDDLLDILRSKAAAKVMAIARRPTLTGSIVRAVIRFGDGPALANLAANDGAPLDEAAYEDMIRLSKSDDLIEESLIARRDLPPLVVEKLIAQASEEIAIRISQRHDLPVQLAITLGQRTRERATIDFIDQSWVAKDLKLMTRRLMDEGRLTDSLMVRAACCGQMRFTEYGLAARAGISHAKAALMLHESGTFGMQALGVRARLSHLSVQTLRGAAAIFRDLETASVQYDRAYFQNLMIQRVLTLPYGMDEDDADYLLEKLDGLTDYAFDLEA
ncbi:DUF2336 domain-containing protein [Robiginitomaculum antarcticum]|uniref:DUF2336 domain-containing protein n=1 Tax=Robiginitomaculum antarcticum TaxID=437507 RepID=UPI000380C111|nr:DUF2336 domain-containing protein [Robiginitomaculum antarcticum]